MWLVGVWWVCGWCVVGMWLVCGWCVVSMWLVCGQYVVRVWSVCGWCVVGVWVVCGWCVVSMWLVWVSVCVYVIHCRYVTTAMSWMIWQILQCLYLHKHYNRCNKNFCSGRYVIGGSIDHTLNNLSYWLVQCLLTEVGYGDLGFYFCLLFLTTFFQCHPPPIQNTIHTQRIIHESKEDFGPENLRASTDSYVVLFLSPLFLAIRQTSGQHCWQPQVNGRGYGSGARHSEPSVGSH